MFLQHSLDSKIKVAIIIILGCNVDVRGIYIYQLAHKQSTFTFINLKYSTRDFSQVYESFIEHRGITGYLYVIILTSYGVIS